MSPPLIKASMIRAELGYLADQIGRLEAGGIDALHFDVEDDGDNQTILIGPAFIRGLRKYTKLPFDVHVRFGQPDRSVDQFLDAGADCLMLQLEMCVAPEVALSHIRDRGCRAGLAIYPDTAATALASLLDLCDEINVMTVAPGRPGRLIEKGVDSVRAVTDMDELGERTFWIDCDVIQADGGTRTASVAGAFVALADAVAVIRKKGLIKKNPLKDYLAAVSVGKVGGEMLADLCYAEDSIADVDLNLVMTGKGEFVEVQGTAERCAFSQEELQKFLSLGWSGIKALVKVQQDLVGALR